MEASAEMKELLEKYLGDRMTTEELERFKVLLAIDAQREELEDNIEKILEQKRFNETSGLDRDEIFSKIIGKRPIYPYLLNRWWAAAAVILVMLGTGFYFWSRHSGVQQEIVILNVPPGGNKAMLTLADGSKVALDSADNKVFQQGNTAVKQKGGVIEYTAKGAATGFNTLSTPRGGQFKVVLPDGTTVWLNAASTLRYPIAFTGNERKVSVTGEAYFDVAKNEQQPFLVELNGETAVEVLGTAFNINSYKEEPGIKITLIEGAINVRKGPEKVQLKPGQQAQPTTASIAVYNADTAQVTAWKNGLFNFHNAGVEEVMHQLSRWYDIEVIYEGQVPSLTFDGKMGRDLNLTQVIKILKYMNLNFRIEDGNKLVVMP
jgi:ferric-dicitrate binding protein FerR (iron transport regulator)